MLRAFICTLCLLLRLHSLPIPEPLIWFISNLTVLVNFLLLAKRWPHLMMHWEDVERRLPTYDHPTRNHYFVKEIKFYTAFITVMLFGEIVFYGTLWHLVRSKWSTPNRNNAFYLFQTVVLFFFVVVDLQFPIRFYLFTKS